MPLDQVAELAQRRIVYHHSTGSDDQQTEGNPCRPDRDHANGNLAASGRAGRFHAGRASACRKGASRLAGVAAGFQQSSPTERNTARNRTDCATRGAETRTRRARVPRNDPCREGARCSKASGGTHVRAPSAWPNTDRFARALNIQWRQSAGIG